MMSPNDRDMHTAYHEAGHWIAADTLDVQTDMMSIIPSVDGTGGRIGVAGDEGYWIPPGTDPFSPENELAFREWATTQAVIDYAGHAAVVALLGVGDMTDECASSNGADADFEKARLRLSDDTARIAAAKMRAMQIVQERQADITLIADKLMALGRLDSQQAAMLVDGVWHLFFNDDGSQRS